MVVLHINLVWLERQSALLDYNSTEHVHNMKSTLDHYSLTIDDKAW